MENSTVGVTLALLWAEVWGIDHGVEMMVLLIQSRIYLGVLNIRSHFTDTRRHSVSSLHAE